MQSTWLGENNTRLHYWIPDVSTNPTEMSLPRQLWVMLHTCVGWFHFNMYKCGLAPPLACECAAEEETADHMPWSVPNTDFPVPMEHIIWRL